MHFIKRFAVATTVAASLTAGTSVASIEINQPNLNELIQTEKINGNRLLVKFREATSEHTMLQTLQPFTFTNIKSFYSASNLQNLALPGLAALSQWRVITFEANTNLGDTFQDLKNNPNVESVVPDVRVTASATPNDLDTLLWGLNNTGQDGGTADADIDAVEAWDTVTDASNVIVAVIDSGVDYTHPELAANMWTNSGEIAGNGIDDDGNGYIDDIHGYDFANNDGDPMDDNSHGTHVSGTIAAEGNNGSGIVGVAWKAQIMALKFLGANGSGYTSDAVDAVLYAADNGAVLSNNSWGSFGSTYLLEAFNAPLKAAIETAGQAGHLFVAAAGNDGDNVDSNVSAYPAGIPLTNIISVAATDRNDEIAYFSNYGEVEVDLAAPGVDIYSTIPGGLYDSYNGTSMATPHVAGAAALLYAIKPDLSPQETKAILMNTVDPIASLAGKVGSGGRLNVASALDALSEGATCTSYTASAQAHITAGRAHGCGFFNMYACANGSNTQIGSIYVTTPVEIIESSPGYFDVGQCEAGLDLPPYITMDGDAETRLLVGDTYTAPSATATDREDASLSVTTSGAVNTSTPGNYVIEYNATDSAGNTATTERRFIQVLDSDTPPEIYLFGEVCILPLWCEPMFVEQFTSFVEPGFFAVDQLDGELTDQVQSFGSVLTDTSTIGRFRVQYDVTDSSGQSFPNFENLFRDVFVLHAENPYVYLDPEYVEFTHARGVCCTSSYTSTFAMDLKDEFNAAITEGEVDEDTVGTYVLRHYYTDTDGNMDERYQTIHVVVDVTPPTITLIGDANINVIQGEHFHDPWAIGTDDIDEYPLVDREGTVDTDVLGTYQLRYWAFDDSGNESVSVYRTVNVVTPCTEFNDTNTNHISAGRAYACGSFNLNACAQGSGDNLGSQWLYTPTTIHELVPGSGAYYAGSCPN